MTTGLAFAVLTLAAVGTAAAAVFVLRAVPAAPAQGPVATATQDAAVLDNPPTLANQNVAAQNLRSVTPEETRPTLVPPRPPVNLTAMPEYDPDQESEDDVPTTLFHSEDSAEIEAFVADLEEKRGR